MPVPVISIAQMREWEAATWAAGQTEQEVIRQVGCALASRARELTPQNGSILILAGKGHNGDDARAAKALLADRRVELLDIHDAEADFPKLDSLLVNRPDLIIDGLFGIGLNRALGPEWVQLIQRVNETHVPMLAVDVPSGMNGNTGEAHGAAIEASVTLTIGAPKSGLLTPGAIRFVGRLEVLQNVGLIPCPFQGELLWTLPEDFDHFPPTRTADGHKGTYGHLGIVAGSLGYHGASVLAARGAQRAQPGLITLHTLESVYYPVASQLQSVMVAPWLSNSTMPRTYSAVLVGPGLAEEGLADSLKATTRLLWRDSPHPIIIDASALDWLQMDPLSRSAVRVITPHPGEAARLLRSTTQQVQANRPEALRNLSRRYGNAWVVLKGHQTLIGRSTGEIFVNSSGNAYLAQGGSGDVLAGYLAGLLAQAPLQTDPLNTIRYAVWQHGATADFLQATRTSWIIDDLLVHLGSQNPIGMPANPHSAILP
jgi:hydroxyethylthiazole kinase-like uncharacterized protein yjeF